MAKKKKTRIRFTEEFKAETVKLVKQSDRSMSSVAMELGISIFSDAARLTYRPPRHDPSDFF